MHSNAFHHFRPLRQILLVKERGPSRRKTALLFYIVDIRIIDSHGDILLYRQCTTHLSGLIIF